MNSSPEPQGLPRTLDGPADREGGINPNRVGIFMDVLARIIAHLNESPQLQKIFGIPVMASLVLVADDDDLRIEDGGRVRLTREQAKVFLAVLEEALALNAATPY